MRAILRIAMAGIWPGGGGAARGKSAESCRSKGLRPFPRADACARNAPFLNGVPVHRTKGPAGRRVVCGKEIERAVQVLVRDNNVDQALRVLKKKMQREGVFREMKLRRNYEKPSERRAREKAEAVRRYRKLMRKRMEREGY